MDFLDVYDAVLPEGMGLSVPDGLQLPLRYPAFNELDFHCLSPLLAELQIVLLAAGG